MMKLHNESLQWIYNHTDDLKRALVTLDFAREHRAPTEDITRRRADEAVHDLAFSFLMVSMGEHIPKTLWSADDYPVLYGLIMDEKNDLEVTTMTNETEVFVCLVILAITVIPISFLTVFVMSREIDTVIKRCESMKRWAKRNLDERDGDHHDE